MQVYCARQVNYSNELTHVCVNFVCGKTIDTNYPATNKLLRQNSKLLLGLTPDFISCRKSVIASYLCRIYYYYMCRSED